MKIELNTTMVDLENNPLKDGGKEVTLGTICCNALLVPDPKEQNAGKKAEKYSLALKMFNQEEIEVAVEDVALIKKCINAAYAQPLIVGQAYKLLEGD